MAGQARQRGGTGSGSGRRRGLAFESGNRGQADPGLVCEQFLGDAVLVT